MPYMEINQEVWREFYRPGWREFASVWRAIGFVAALHQRPYPIRVRTQDLGPLDRGKVLLTWRELARADTYAARNAKNNNPAEILHAAEI